MNPPEEDVRPFSQVQVPAPVRIPGPVVLVVALALVLGVMLGLLTGQGTALRLVRAVFFGSAFGYLTVSIIDFWEHFRLEKVATGRYFAFVAIPPGESLNHTLTTLTVVLLLLLARPPGASLEARDLYVLVAPALFLFLGWRDELVYHRRRCAHREDMMHTTAHLAAGVMLTSFVMMRMVPLNLL